MQVHVLVRGVEVVVEEVFSEEQGLLWTIQGMEGVDDEDMSSLGM